MSAPTNQDNLTGRVISAAKGTCAKIAASNYFEEQIMGTRAGSVTLTKMEAMSLCAVASEALGIREAIADLDEDDAICILREFKLAEDHRLLLQELSK